ncbi:hypothetical protein GGR56DRAFT_674220 [Xylariaceae sp. FL0804]|nr:hypothetical protein GGR56DRAFT_674220 [Xylariaceae sp. FL0804]
MAVKRRPGKPGKPGIVAGMRQMVLPSALRLTSQHSHCTAAPVRAAARAQEDVDHDEDDEQQQQPKAATTAPSYDAVVRGKIYIEALPPDIEPIRGLLEKYSGIRARDVDAHIHDVRDRLWDVYPHASIGHFRFLSLSFTSDPRYQRALARLLLRRPGSSGSSGSSSAPSAPARLVDVGCGVGQLVRKLASAGVDGARLHGVDVEPRFLQAGYELFRDRGRLAATFVVGDVVNDDGGGDEDDEDDDEEDDEDGKTTGNEEGEAEQDEERDGSSGSGGDDERINSRGNRRKKNRRTAPPTTGLRQLDGRMTFVHATSFFHLFTWAEQVRAASRMVRFLDPRDPDVMIFGRHVGLAARATTTTPPAAAGRHHRVFLHDAASWRALWDEVGARTGTGPWDARLEVLDDDDDATGAVPSVGVGAGSSYRRVRFGVYRA